MGLEELEDDIRQLERDLDEMIPRKKAAAVKLFLDRFMPLALMGLGSLIAFHFFIPVNETLAAWVDYLSIALIAFFSIRFGLAFILASSHKKFLRQHWFDAMLVLPLFTLVAAEPVLAALESETEEEAFVGFFFARNTTLASQVTKMYEVGRRLLRM